MVTEQPRLAIASDHGGFELKQSLRAHLVEVGYDCVDLGPDTKTSVDYPIYAAAVARQVATGEADRGVLVCGSGIGMSIAANKVNGVRAAVVQDVEHARLAGEHNSANVLCLGGRFTALEHAVSMVQAWLSAECVGERHHRRIGRISDLENA